MSERTLLMRARIKCANTQEINSVTIWNSERFRTSRNSITIPETKGCLHLRSFYRVSSFNRHSRIETLGFDLMGRMCVLRFFLDLEYRALLTIAKLDKYDKIYLPTFVDVRSVYIDRIAMEVNPEQFAEFCEQN